MRIEGRPTAAICDALGVERRTVYLWFSDPLVKAELRGQLQPSGPCVGWWSSASSSSRARCAIPANLSAKA